MQCTKGTAGHATGRYGTVGHGTYAKPWVGEGHVAFRFNSDPCIGEVW